MHTLGSTFIPPALHAGGLRYRGMAPLVSHIKDLGRIEARAYKRKSGVVTASGGNHGLAVAHSGRQYQPGRWPISVFRRPFLR